MSRLQRFLWARGAAGLFLGVLAVAYLCYLAVFGNVLQTTLFRGDDDISEYEIKASPASVLQHWTPEAMRAARDVSQINNDDSSIGLQSNEVSEGKPGQQQGQAPRNSNVSYPLSTVGKLFFSSQSGVDMVCSGSAIVSSNRSVVDTAGHCLYWDREWVKNVVFCPLYENGSTPLGCWVARELQVPEDWINAPRYDFHHDFGMAVVAANSNGLLTDVVGGAGWAYNQPVNQAFYAYGYPAGYPFDGETRKSCESSTGRLWNHGAGTVVSIPCDMTGGSSGGPWFIQKGGQWYVNGHNDFISSLKPGHMFSPYYDDTWYELYQQAQKA